MLVCNLAFVFAVACIIHQSHSSSDLETILHDPAVIFARSPEALDGCSDQDRASSLINAISKGGSESAVPLIGALLHGLNEMNDPYVSRPVAEAVSKVLEDECSRLVSVSEAKEIDRTLDDDSAISRFMYDLRLLRNAPVMRQYLLRSFYRVVGRAIDGPWQRMALALHWESMQAKTASEETAVLGIVLPCVILEAVYSADFLVVFCKGLLAAKFGVLHDCRDDLVHLVAYEPRIDLYFKVIEMYTSLEAPLASQIAMLHSGIDWKQVIRVYQMPQMDSFELSSIPKLFRISLPVDSEDPEQMNAFERLDIQHVIQVVASFVFGQLRHHKTAPLIDLRPGIRRHINFLWRREHTLWAQTFAMAACSIYDMDSWEGEVGWKARRWSGAESGKMARSEQVTVFHDLPREILKVIGPVMPVLVSKATYQLVELRASYSNMLYFVGKILRPFDTDAILRLQLLHGGWGAGLARSELLRVGSLVYTSDVPWIDRLWGVAEAEENNNVVLARQGRIGMSSPGYIARPPGKVALLTFSLAFGTGPFEMASAAERLDLLLIIKSQFPCFVCLVQALEAMTRDEKSKLSRLNRLIGLRQQANSTDGIFQEWALTEYLSDSELFALVRACDVESAFWAMIVGTCKSASLTNPAVALGALKKCAGLFRRGFLENSIETFKLLAMGLGLGIPKSTAEGMFNGDREALLKVFFNLGPSEMEALDLRLKTGLVSRLSGWLLGRSSRTSYGPPINPIVDFQIDDFWYGLLNCSEDLAIGILQRRQYFARGARLLLSHLLSGSAKDKIIADYAESPQLSDGDTVRAVLMTDRHYDGWEPESVVFEGRRLRSEQYRGSLGSSHGVLEILSEHYKDKEVDRDRFDHLLAAHLTPEMVNFVKAARRDRPEFEIVLPMLLAGRTVRSIGKNLYLLADGNFERIGEILSRSRIKQHYVDEINVAVAEFAQGPGKVTSAGGNGHAQVRQFIEAFDPVAVEGDLPLAARVFKDVLRALAVAKSYDDRRTFGLIVKYSDGEVRDSVTVPQHLPPAYLFKAILKTVKEPFELVSDCGNLHAATTVADLGLPDTIVVRVVHNVGEIVGQLKILFRLVMQAIAIGDSGNISDSKSGRAPFFTGCRRKCSTRYRRRRKYIGSSSSSLSSSSSSLSSSSDDSSSSSSSSSSDKRRKRRKHKHSNKRGRKHKNGKRLAGRARGRRTMYSSSSSSSSDDKRSRKSKHKNRHSKKHHKRRKH